MQPLLDWMREQVDGAEEGPLYGLVDLNRIGIVGHSRGAKLAALMLASEIIGMNHPAAIWVVYVTMCPDAF